MRVGLRFRAGPEPRGTAWQARPWSARICKLHTTVASWQSNRKEFVDSYVPDKIFYLNDGDRQCLHNAGRSIPLPLPGDAYARRILERLQVDLSWASSRMEGNTYDILETERLIRFGEEAAGKDRKETVMILNH